MIGNQPVAQAHLVEGLALVLAECLGNQPGALAQLGLGGQAPGHEVAMRLRRAQPAHVGVEEQPVIAQRERDGHIGVQIPPDLALVIRMPRIAHGQAPAPAIGLQFLEQGLALDHHIRGPAAAVLSRACRAQRQLQIAREIAGRLRPELRAVLPGLDPAFQLAGLGIDDAGIVRDHGASRVSRAAT